ncbi:hypothetical protein WJX84_001630 [Apatococcus fuscideae]|uniref:UBC core domain-containing protein n=1 Tax=Apatococcus fuscideae TaxID=2026836 RepID=A0AAW1SE34_9CHLO
MSRPCLKRLLRDLKEVLQHPLPDVVARPLENSLLIWHGNVRGREGAFKGCVIHFVLVFSERYPQEAPQVRLYQAIPHPNVFRTAAIGLRGAEGSNHRLAIWDCLVGQDAWSSAYTVLSILVQLQAFLLDEDLQYEHQKVLPETAVSIASKLEGLRLAAKDGAVWRNLLHREFPCSELTASSAADWEHTYALQATAVMEDLQCFFTKAPFTEQILGVPLRFTTNPKTKVIDYIEAGLDLVSQEAVRHLGVTKTLAGDAIQGFLPLYLTHAHFELVKAGRSLDRALSLLAPEAIAPGRKTPSFGNFLNVMPKMLNTAIVLLMDQGVAASDRALITYCGLHRLFLALAEDFGLLHPAAEKLDR